MKNHCIYYWSHCRHASELSTACECQRMCIDLFPSHQMRLHEIETKSITFNDYCYSMEVMKYLFHFYNNWAGQAQRTQIEARNFEMLFAGYGLTKVKVKHTENKEKINQHAYNAKQTSKYLHTFRFFVQKQQITFIRNNNQLKHANTQIQFIRTLGIQIIFFCVCYLSCKGTKQEQIWIVCHMRYCPKYKRLNSQKKKKRFRFVFVMCKILLASHCCIFVYNAKCCCNFGRAFYLR